ncbi:MAG: hypothetical protein LKE52_01860 [Bacilli bacterium]|jgi:hypothetical protein|nr:hypothetical protein [Bacilli bacterium]
MNENIGNVETSFKRFKRKILREHILKSSLLSLTIGLGATAICVACFRLISPYAVIGLQVGVDVGVGVLAAAAAFLLFYFLKKPTDAAIAKRVDADLNLHEKVATMVEFKDKSGLVIDRQRKDSLEKLEKRPTKAVPVRLAVWSVPVLIAAAGLFIGSFFAPKNAIGEKIAEINGDKPIRMIGIRRPMMM